MIDGLLINTVDTIASVALRSVPFLKRLVDARHVKAFDYSLPSALVKDCGGGRSRTENLPSAAAAARSTSQYAGKDIPIR